MKPGVFSQLYIQLVFAVKHRENLLHREKGQEVHKYMSGILTGLKHKSIIINGMPDHIHILFGLNPSVAISETVHALKRNSSLHINKQKFFRGKFSWQEGYGAFSYSRSQLDNVYQYIKNQETHHTKRSFRNEYVNLLNEFDVSYENQFLFDFVE
jgi:REP element-mobilizing transposase RayT